MSRWNPANLHGLRLQADSTSLTQVVVQRLRQAILEGAFQPGQRLRQAEIAAAFGVSHIPVREAFARLAEEGLVVLRPQRGAMVAAPNADYVSDVYDVLTLLTGSAIENAVPQMSDEQVEAMARYLDELESTPAQDRQRRLRLHDQFHGSLYRAAGNAVLTDLIITYGRQVTAFLTLYKAQQQPPSHDPEHRALLDAVRARDGHHARQIMEAHLRHGRERILGRMRSISGSGA